MPYVRKPYKPRAKSARRPTYRKRPTASMRRIAQQVLNRNVETKSQIATHGTNVALGHNVPRLIANNLLLTTQGVGSDSVGQTRLGDKINPRGIKLYFQCRQYQPTTATNYENGEITIKIWILKQHHSLINNTSDYLRTIVANNMMNPVDMKRGTTVKTLTFKLKNMYSTWNAAPSVLSAPAFKTLTVWIPMYKIRQYLYESNATNNGKFFNVCMHAMAYGAHPNLLADDHIADFTCSSEVFFKDP